MAGLSLQHYILDLPVVISVDPAVRKNHLSRHFALHHAGLLCLRADIIHPFPLQQILRHRLPVKKDNRDVLFPGKVYDLRRIRPVYEINAEYIAPRINQLLHLIVLRSLRACCVPHRHDCFQIA